MREYLGRARWVLYVRAGLTYALPAVAAALFVGRSPAEAAGPGLVGGAVYGLLAGDRQAERRAAEDGVLAQVPPEGRRAARSAARRGLVPRDPVVRDAALRRAELRMSDSSGWSFAAAVSVLVVSLVVSLLLATQSSGRPFAVGLLAAALGAGALVSAVGTRVRRLRRALLLRTEARRQPV